MLYPVVWMVAASFRPSAEVMNSLGLFSKNYTLDNYKHGWSAGQLNFSRYFLNSIAITALSIVGNLVSCSLTAYAFARLEFPFKRILFGVLLATMLLPYHVTWCRSTSCSTSWPGSTPTCRWSCRSGSASRRSSSS